MSDERDDEQETREEAERKEQEAHEEAQREESAIRDETGDMATKGQDMERRLGELQDDIDQAEHAKKQRQDAPDATLIAGDWEDASSGAQQGEDPVEAVDDDRAEGDADGDGDKGGS